MITDSHSAQNLRARSHIDMTPKDRRAADGAADSERHLLKQKAIRPYDGSVGNHNSVWVGQQQSTADPSVQGNLRAADN